MDKSRRVRTLEYKTLSTGRSVEKEFAWASHRVWNRIDGYLFIGSSWWLGYRRENMVATPGEVRFVEVSSTIFIRSTRISPLRLDSLITEGNHGFNSAHLMRRTQRSMDVIEECAFYLQTHSAKEAVWKAQTKIHALYERTWSLPKSEHRDQVSKLFNKLSMLN